MTADDELAGSAFAGHRDDARSPRLSRLEWLTLAHVGVLAIAATWAFGGNAASVRVPLSCWASLGVVITIASLRERIRRGDGAWSTLHWLWPLAGFNALVLAGMLNPAFREVVHDGETMYIGMGNQRMWPTAAFPQRTLPALWLFDATWIACLNLALVIRHRRALRGLLLVLVLNAVVLAVLGTVQKLSGATELYFGAVPSPQKHFFATFVYHNHWGAFAVLMLAAGLALTWYHARRWQARNVFHSPVFAAAVALVLLAVSVPLSTSRSCSIMAGLLLSVAGIHVILAIARRRRRQRESVAWPVAVAVMAALLTAGAVWFVARETIALRIEKTREQIADMRARGTIGARAVLYADTWRMAADRPWFGWGMASYPHVFTLYNSRQSVDHLPVFYHDAHSDWLQALAEHGFIGTALLALCALVPLFSVGGRQFSSTLTRYLLMGCTLLLLYAWVEFPFGNVAVVIHWWICFFAALQHARLGGGSTQPA